MGRPSLGGGTTLPTPLHLQGLWGQVQRVRGQPRQLPEFRKQQAGELIKSCNASAQEDLRLRCERPQEGLARLLTPEAPLLQPNTSARPLPVTNLILTSQSCGKKACVYRRPTP